MQCQQFDLLNKFSVETFVIAIAFVVDVVETSSTQASLPAAVPYIAHFITFIYYYIEH